MSTPLSIPQMLAQLRDNLTATEETLGESLSDLDGVVLMVSSTHAELELVRDTLLDIRNRIELAIRHYSDLDQETLNLWAQAAALLTRFSRLRFSNNTILSVPSMPPPPPPPSAVTASEDGDSASQELSTYSDDNANRELPTLSDDDADHELPTPSDDELTFPSPTDNGREDFPAKDVNLNARHKRTRSSIEGPAAPSKKTKFQVSARRPNWQGQESASASTSKNTGVAPSA